MKVAQTRAVRWAARLIERMTAHQIGEQATVIAFNIVYSLFPLALSLTAIGGFIVRGAAERAVLLEEIRAAFPEELAREMGDVINAAGSYSGLFGLVGFVTLLWAGSNLFAAIEVSFARIFGVPSRGIMHQRAMAVLMILAFSLLLVVSLTASDAAVFLAGGPYLGLAGGWVFATLMQLVIYAVIPNVKIPFRALWPGAVVAGTALQVITLAFPLYLRYLGGFNRFGDAFSLVFLVMTWSYLLGFILLAGAEVIALRYADIGGGR